MRPPNSSRGLKRDAWRRNGGSTQHEQNLVRERKLERVLDYRYGMSIRLSPSNGARLMSYINEAAQ